MKKDKQELLDLARKRLDRSIEKDEHNRESAIDDLKFLNGDTQWDEGEKRRRSLAHRPTLQINLMPKFVDQVTGDQRQNRPRVKVRPVDSKADPAIAKIREGIIWNIEYLSNADAIYDQACEMQVSCGYGAWRILTRYCPEAPFVQEIYLEPIDNPFLVYMDTEAKDFMFSDAEWGFVLDKMPKEEFEETYPKAKNPADEMDFGQGVNYEHWYDENTVTVAEYYVRERVKQPMAQMDNGDILTLEEANQKISEWEEKNAAIPPASIMPNADMGAGPGFNSFPPVPDAPVEPRPVIAKQRDADKIVVKHYLLTFSEVLKEETVAGSFIPVVLLRGRMRNIEGKPYIRGLVRDGKDPQRLVNYWNTAAAEVIALAPKAPWIGTAKQFEGYEEDYAQANIENFPFLKFNPDAEAPGPPQRVPMADPPVAMFAQISRAEENLKSVIGMFNRDVGDQGPEMSGVALTRAQTPSDVSTFAFIDNLSRAISHSGRIINEMIPEIYDTERDVRLRNIDDTETFAPINTSAMAALKSMQGNPERYQGMDLKKLQKAIRKEGPTASFNDITAGKYGVVVTIGPSFTTQRQESAENMMKLVQADPQRMMGLAGDLIVRNMDFKDSDELAERLEKTLPPGLKRLKEGEEPPPPPPPDPNALISQAMVQIEQLKLENQKQKLEFDREIQAQKLAIEKMKVMKEGLTDKNETRKEVLAILQEVFSEQHPADGLMQENPINQGDRNGPEPNRG